MIRLLRTDSDNRDFAELVKFLDIELAERDGADHAFYATFNKIDQIKFVVLAYDGERPLGCGALKVYGPTAMEIKRMYVSPEHRGRGIAAAILSELESWARELSFEKCILETGKKQPEAIRLYQKTGYAQIPNYGQYAGVDNSLCFEKKLD